MSARGKAAYREADMMLGVKGFWPSQAHLQKTSRNKIK